MRQILVRPWKIAFSVMTLVVSAGPTFAGDQQGVASAQPDLPVETRSTTKAKRLKPQTGPLPAPASFFTGNSGIVTDNTGSIELKPPAAAVTAPPLGTSFEGIPDTFATPANPNLAVGPNQIVQTVNGALRVTDRLGSGLETTDTLENLFGVPTGATGLSDPVCQYDHFNDRFVVMTTARNAAQTDGWYVVAVTKGRVPFTVAATWSVYYLRNDIDLPSTNTDNCGDYAKIGFDETYFYITSNQHDPTDVFQYAKVRMYKKTDFYGRRPVSGIEFNDVRDASGNRVFTIQPAITFGTPGREYLASCTPGAGNSITVFSIDTTVNTRTLVARSVAVNSWLPPQSALQRFPGPQINSGDARLLNAVVRNNRLFVAHTVRRGTFPCACQYIGVNGANFGKALDATIGSPSFYYYYPAISVTAAGGLGTVFNFSSLMRYPGAMYTQISSQGGVLPLAILREGDGNYFLTVNGRAPWGEYNGIAVDPASPGRLWFNAMYATSNPFSWGTYVGSTSLFGGREGGTAQEAGTAAKDQLRDWLKTTPVFGPLVP